MEILSQMWSLLGLLTVFQNVLPSQLLSLFHSLYESLQNLFSLYSYFKIFELNDYCDVDLNDIYLKERHRFTLHLLKRHRHVLLLPYLTHMTSRVEEFKRVSRERWLFTNNTTASVSFESGWVSVPFYHPTTFKTLALDPKLRKLIWITCTIRSESH